MNIIQKKYILVRDELAVPRQLLYLIFNPKDLIFLFYYSPQMFRERFFENENRNLILQSNSISWCKSFNFWLFQFLFCFLFLVIFVWGISNQIVEWFGWEPIFIQYALLDMCQMTYIVGAQAGLHDVNNA